MTPIADMVEQMLTANEPAIAIIAAVRALEAVTHNNALRNAMSRVTGREQARIRQQNFRNKQKEQKLAKEAQANDGAYRNAKITRDSVTPMIGEPLTSLSINKEGLPVEGKEVRKKEGRESARARGTRMPAAAVLTAEFTTVAIEVGAALDLIPKIWTEFVDYWSDIPGQRGCKLSWLGTWRNNVKRVLANGHWIGQKNGRRTVHDAARDLSENIRKLMEPPPDGLCDGTGASPLRLISQGRRERS